MLASPSDTASKIQSYWNTRNCALDCSKRLYWYHHPQALAHYRRLVSRR